VRREAASAASSRRIACNGETRRSTSSGRSAKTNATQTPIPIPKRIADGTIETVTSTGSNPERISGRMTWIAMPRAAPMLAPTSPIAAACTR